MWFLRPSVPATILQSYDQNISYTIRKTGTKHWPQTLFQHFGGVDSLQLYHSAGRFTARIRTDTIRRLAPMDMRLGQHNNRRKIMTMRKMIYLVGAVAIAVVAAGYVWSPSTQIPSPQRVMATEVASMISPTEIMISYKRPLPVEQWDAF
jgi:hypothetical protein